MAKLTSEHRNNLASRQFGMPKERKYPMPDASHARNAKARASEMEHKGKISEGEKEKIDAKADRVMGKSHEHGAMKHATSHLEKHHGHRHHHD